MESGKFVLWLKDTSNVYQNGTYLRGDEFATIKDAQESAASSPSAGIMHHIWMRQTAIEVTYRVMHQHWDGVSSRLPRHNPESAIKKYVGLLRMLPVGKIVTGAAIAREAHSSGDFGPFADWLVGLLSM